MTECARTGCTAPARWLPVFVIYAHTGSPARATVSDLPCCDAHKAATTLADLLTDEGWAQIVASFLDRGFAAPVRPRTRLDWEPLAP